MTRQQQLVAAKLEGRDVLAIAHTCHESTRIFQARMTGATFPPWDLAGQELQDECVRRVTEVASGRAKQPEDLHAHWVERMRKDGWRLGLVVDRAEQKHPLLVDFNDLTLRERTQYALFFNVAQTLLFGVAMMRASE
jgi:hypothetical protein